MLGSLMVFPGHHSGELRKQDRTKEIKHEKKLISESP